MTDLDQVMSELAALWAPPPKITVSQWATKNRRLSSESSARAGEWRTRSYQREPMDCFTDPAVHTIILMVARQTLKTEVINNCAGYAIDCDPGPMLVVQFRDTDVRKWSKIRLMPMLKDTPVLRQKVLRGKVGGKGDPVDYKEFPGGHLSIVASASPGNLSALPIRYLFCDEIDKYPASADKAGDPISLAQGRQEEFWNRKTVLACTPTIDGRSRIQSFWKLSDQREFFVPCPKCERFQVTKWDQVRWDSDLPAHKQPATARYECENPDCKHLWSDGERFRAINRGHYRATAPFSGMAGFRVSGISRIGTKLSAMVEEWLQKKDNPEQRKTFVNEQLAECYAGEVEAIDWEILQGRAEKYQLGTVPDGVLFLTWFADVQKDRIEVAVWGWGRRAQSWLVNYEVIDGDTADDEVWEKLKEFARKPYKRSNGLEMGPLKYGVDAGYRATMVYRFCRQMGKDRFYPVFGRATGQVVFWRGEPQDLRTRKGKTIKRGLRPWFMNTSQLKQDFYGWLNTEDQNSDTYGRVHLPVMPEHWLQQLTAEQLVTTMRGGHQHSEWQLIPGRERNEALDTRDGCQALAEHIGLTRFVDTDWEAYERFYQVEAERRQVEQRNVPVVNVPPQTTQTPAAIVTQQATPPPSAVAQPPQPAPARRGRVRFRFNS